LLPEFTSPYRPDPRPLQGVHLGLHAFLAVTELRLRALRAGRFPATALRDLIDTHWRNLFALETILRHEELSNGGRHYYGTISHRLEEQDVEIRERLTRAANGPCATSLRADFWAERIGHRMANIGIEFGSQSPMSLWAQFSQPR
jgi:hypothetical protein